MRSETASMPRGGSPDPIAAALDTACHDVSRAVRRAAIETLGQRAAAANLGAIAALCTVLRHHDLPTADSTDSRFQAERAISGAFRETASSEVRRSLITALGRTQNVPVLLAASARLSDARIRQDEWLRCDLLALARVTGNSALLIRLERLRIGRAKAPGWLTLASRGCFVARPRQDCRMDGTPGVHWPAVGWP